MRRYVPWLLGSLIVLLLVGGPVGYARYRHAEFRNFRVVKEGVLYRSGQLTLPALKRIIHDHGIRTVITLRDAPHPGGTPPDAAEEKYCRGLDINYHRIPPRNWGGPNGQIPADQSVRQFLEIMDNPKNHPVLIHCFAGSHRTGAYCAIYRMEYDRWPNAAALAEMKACGYANLDDEWDILDYLEGYRSPRGNRAVSEVSE